MRINKVIVRQFGPAFLRRAQERVQDVAFISVPEFLARHYIEVLAGVLVVFGIIAIFTGFSLLREAQSAVEEIENA